MKALLQAMLIAVSIILPSAVSAQTVLARTPEYQIIHLEVDGNGVIAFQGDMTLGSSDRIIMAMQMTQSSNLVMHSPGGFMIEAYQLGFAIRQMGVAVLIAEGNACLSACAFAVMASDNLHVNGLLGFHSPYIEEVPSGMSIESFGAMERGVMLQMMTYSVMLGYSIGLVADIHEYTTRDEYIVFDDEADLNRFRYNGVLTYDEDMPTLYTIMHTNQITEYIQAEN